MMTHVSLRKQSDTQAFYTLRLYAGPCADLVHEPMAICFCTHTHGQLMYVAQQYSDMQTVALSQVGGVQP